MASYAEVSTYHLVRIFLTECFLKLLNPKQTSGANSVKTVADLSNYVMNGQKTKSFIPRSFQNPKLLVCNDAEVV